MLRRLAVVAALCLLPMGNAVFALGLGEIKVTSGLNQTFEATIPFTSLTADEADSIKVTLADNDAFARAGLDRAQYLSSLNIEVVTEGRSPHILIESSQIVREPLLTILIEVRAGGPRIFREYTVLLDPPGPESNVSRPFSRVEAVPKKSSPDVPAPSEFYQAAKQKPLAPPREPKPEFIPGSTSYGPLGVGDTLWSIGQKVRPTAVPVSVEQAMLALYQNNPDGFVNGNPNTLRRGAMLSVPNADVMRRVDAATAKEQVRKLMAGEPLTEASSAPAEPTSATPPAAPEGVSATGETAAPAGSGTGAAPAEGAGAPPAEAGTGTPPAEGTAPAATPKPEEAPVKRPPEPSMMSKLVPILIGVLVLAIGLVLWRSYRERKATREYEEASRAAAAPPLHRSTASAMPKAPVSARDELEAVNRRLAEEDVTRVADDDRTVAKPGPDFETVAVSTGKMPPYTGPQAGGRPESDVAKQFENNTLQIDLAANDPIAEADFHLAYGLYEEAALLLRQAAEREPGRTDVRVKLAETYFAAGKPAEFQDIAESLKPQLGDEEWGKLAIMGRQLCPDSPMFAGAGGGDVSVDLSFDEPGEGSTVAPPKRARVDDGLDFSLEELELPGRTAKAGGKSAADQPIEFDLGEFDLAGARAAQPAPKVNVPSVGELSLKDFDLAGSNLADKARQGLDIRLEDVHPDGGGHDAGDTISTGEDVATKLDLARAYVEMGDAGMARTLLDEVASQGNDDQKREAAALRERLLG